MEKVTPRVFSVFGWVGSSAAQKNWFSMAGQAGGGGGCRKSFAADHGHGSSAPMEGNEAEKMPSQQTPSRGPSDLICPDSGPPEDRVQTHKEASNGHT